MNVGHIYGPGSAFAELLNEPESIDSILARRIGTHKPNNSKKRKTKGKRDYSQQVRSNRRK